MAPGLTNRWQRSACERTGIRLRLRLPLCLLGMAGWLAGWHLPARRLGSRRAAVRELWHSRFTGTFFRKASVKIGRNQVARKRNSPQIRLNSSTHAHPRVRSDRHDIQPNNKWLLHTMLLRSSPGGGQLVACIQAQLAVAHTLVIASSQPRPQPHNCHTRIRHTGSSQARLRLASTSTAERPSRMA